MALPELVGDEDIGVLWQWYNDDITVRVLVRKLVEERRKHYYPNLEGDSGYHHALSDFGIDPETWK